MPYPYNSYMNPYGFQYYNQQPMQQPLQQQVPQQMQQPQQQFVNPVVLQGKAVDSIDVVKASEIPYDYSVSYFPLTDGSAIVTKQLMKDGTSRMVVYKPVDTNGTTENVELPKYVTEEQVDQKIKEIQVNDYTSDIKTIKRQIKDLSEDVEDIKNGKDE